MPAKPAPVATHDIEATLLGASGIMRHLGIARLDIYDEVLTAMIVTDMDDLVQHANPSAIALLGAMEDAIRAAHPDFRALALIGSRFALTHREVVNTAHHVAKRGDPFGGVYPMGDAALGMRSRPIHDADGTLLGHVSELWDATPEVASRRMAEKLLQDLEHMAIGHLEGQIDIFMDPDSFDGLFAVAADKVNEMVKSYLRNSMTALNLLREFSMGNFDAPFPQLPGKLADASTAIEGMRTRFKQVLGEIGRVALDISMGKLDTRPAEGEFPGEYQSIVDSFHQILESLNEVMSEVETQTGRIKASLDRSARSAKALAQTASTQSSLVEEMAASTDRTENQVQANAEAASQANALILGTSRTAQDGKVRIDQMTQAMEDIRGSSKDIARIIKVIDEIAFQTNLLALNAAVEAARAGQHGRGFAVVAQEVRNLAGRSAKAARETSELVERATTRVQAGVRIADETSAVFAAITADIETVRSLVAQIASGSEEQAEVIGQIAEAVATVSEYAMSARMDSFEVAASTEAVQVAAEVMGREVARFRLRQREAAPQRPLETPLYALPPELVEQVQKFLSEAKSGRTPHHALPH